MSSLAPVRSAPLSALPAPLRAALQSCGYGRVDFICTAVKNVDAARRLVGDAFEDEIAAGNVKAELIDEWTMALWNFAEGKRGKADSLVARCAELPPPVMFTWQYASFSLNSPSIGMFCLGVLDA